MNKTLESFLSCLVAMAFTIAAACCVWFLYGTFMRHHSAQNWVAVPAQVLSYDLRSNRSRSGTSARFTIQERLVVQYAYTHRGAAYTGDRLDFSVGSDNFSGSRRQAQMAELRTGLVTVYVNPDNPSLSVFDRSLPGSQIVFALVFLLFPCGVGTAVSMGLALSGLGKLGFPGAARFLMPLLGLFHSLPALYPVLFAPASVGLAGWIILLAFLGLLSASLLSLWRRMQDPTLGQPRWPERFGGKMART